MRLHAPVPRLPTSGTVRTSCSSRVRRRMYTGLRRSLSEALRRFDTVGAYERPLSFRDDDAATAVAEVVQGLERHAARHRPVADHGDDAMPGTPRRDVGFAGVDRRVACDREAVGVGQDRRRVAVLDPVVVGLGATGVARQPAGLAQRRELAAGGR